MSSLAELCLAEGTACSVRVCLTASLHVTNAVLPGDNLFAGHPSLLACLPCSSYSLIHHSHTHLLARSLTLAPFQAFIHSLTHSLIRSLALTHTHTPILPPVFLPTHSLTQSHSLMYPLMHHSSTHTLTQSYTAFLFRPKAACLPVSACRYDTPLQMFE